MLPAPRPGRQHPVSLSEMNQLRRVSMEWKNKFNILKFKRREFQHQDPLQEPEFMLLSCPPLEAASVLPCTGGNIIYHIWYTLKLQKGIDTLGGAVEVVVLYQLQADFYLSLFRQPFRSELVESVLVEVFSWVRPLQFQ